MIPFPRILTYGNKVQEFTPLKGELTTLATMPNSINMQQAAANTPGRDTIVFGNRVSPYNLYEYNGSTFSELAQRPTVNIDGAAIVNTSPNNFYIFGGRTRTTNANNNLCHMYISNTQTYIAISNYPEVVYNIQATYDQDNNKIYLSHYRKLYSYDINSNTYTSLSSPTFGPTDANTGISGISYNSGYVYMCYNKIFGRYNISTNQWENIGTMSEGGVGTRIISYINDIYIISGGFNGIWKYSIESNTFTKVNSTFVGNNSSSLCIYKNNSILMSSISSQYRYS